MCNPGLYPAGYHRIRTRSGTLINTGKLGKLYKVLHTGKQCISIYKCAKLSFSPPGTETVFSCPPVGENPNPPYQADTWLHVFLKTLFICQAAIHHRRALPSKQNPSVRGSSGIAFRVNSVIAFSTFSLYNYFWQIIS